MNPCEKCRRYPNCPKVCYPKRDWEKHVGRELKKRLDAKYRQKREADKQ